MLSHVFVGITDYPRAYAFYSRVTKAFSYPLKLSEPEVPWAGWKSAHADRPLFLIGHPFNSKEAASGNGQMVALLAPSRDAVDKSYAAALSNGGRRAWPCVVARVA